ncbi:MAG: penicillin binding protein PBP4B [Elusimicrobiota bacterium]|nr:penicillin binding protein PBP4B [Elusimicrobiota bacterium]
MKRFIIIISFCFFAASANSDDIKITRVKNFLPQPQIDRIFPMPVDSPDYDEAVLPNDAVQFITFKDQGYILVFPSKVEDFELYINNIKIDTLALKKEKINKIDISKISKNGINTIEVYNVVGGGEVRVQAPYAEVLEDLQTYKDSLSFKLIDDIINSEVDGGFPSAQLIVIKDGKVIKKTNYGYINNFDEHGQPLEKSKKIPVEYNTLFDLASNTKMYATNFAIQHLVYEGKIAVDDLVSKYIDGFYDKETDLIKGKDTLTIRDLLSHQSGFAPGVNAYLRAKNGLGLIAMPKNRQEMQQLLVNAPLVSSPRSKAVYSDIDFILLGLIVEKVTGRDLDDYARATFYSPLKLRNISFTPLKNGFGKRSIAATTISSSTDQRGNVVWGVVQDITSYLMGQVAGHAGLFSNATDLGYLAQVMLNGGGYGQLKFFDLPTIEEFTASQNLNDTFALGWRKQGPRFKYANMFGPFASMNAFGHSGWTGTLTVIDPDNNLVIVLLTSKKNALPIAAGVTNGDRYITGKYSAVAALVYAAFIDDSKDANESRIADLIREKQKQIELKPNNNNVANILSLEALIEAQARFLGY